MKLRNRILAILLTLALVLSVMPVVFAAEQVTVTLSTPSGTTTQTLAAGEEFTFPAAESYGEYVFDCWVTWERDFAADFSFTEYYDVGDKVQVNLDVTYYALYHTKGYHMTPWFYAISGNGAATNYSGEYAIVGVNVDFNTGSYLYDNPLALGENGQVVQVSGLSDATMGEYEFYTSATNIVFDFYRLEDSSYTIKNLKTGKFLSVSGTDIAYVSSPDAYSYWNIELDEYGYDCIRNAKNANLYLFYDFYEEYFDIFDNSKAYYEENGVKYYPMDYFFVDLYYRDSYDYLWGTEVPGVEPEPPVELPDHDCPSVKFTDLDLKAWYHDGVDFVLANGYMNGVNSNTFRPNGTLNRAMVATVLYRIAGEPAVEGTCSFSDVGAGQWYTNAVIWAQENGIVTGYTDNTFRPTKEITRQEMAVMLTRYAKLLGVETGSSADLSTYPDAGDVASWAQEAMAWCVEMGLINGVQSGGVSNLKPGNNATRAQFATIMMRYLTME